MVVLKRPFRIGDRISVAGVTGDVIDIQLNHILLNQVGGTVQGEERSGRGIFVPNAMLFGEEIINYNYFGKQEAAASPSRFMLDEVVVRVTFGSDYEFARQLCVEAARQAAGELVGETDADPFTRAEFSPWCVLLRVRYKTIPAKRQEVSARVTKRIWELFGEHRDRVQFAIPVHVTGVRPSAGQPPPPMAAAGPADGSRDARP
jgi:small-conductance mechanosensitive channel